MDLVVTWLLSPELGREKLALLALCMLAGYVVASNLVWHLFYSSETGAFRERSGRWSWIGEWIKQGCRLLYYVGVPSIVFARGVVLSPAGIPTTWITRDGSVRWHQFVTDKVLNPEMISTAAATWIGGACLLSAVWIWYARVSTVSVKRKVLSLWQALREALFFQMLWAFFCGVITVHTANRVYVSFSVLALISLSWLLSPLRRKKTRTPDLGYQTVRDWILAVLTAFAAIHIRSLLLLVFMHWMWLWASDRILRLVAASPHKEKATLLGA